MWLELERSNPEFFKQTRVGIQTSQVRACQSKQCIAFLHLCAFQSLKGKVGSLWRAVMFTDRNATPSWGCAELVCGWVSQKWQSWAWLDSEGGFAIPQKMRYEDGNRVDLHAGSIRSCRRTCLRALLIPLLPRVVDSFCAFLFSQLFPSYALAIVFFLASAFTSFCLHKASIGSSIDLWLRWIQSYL